MAQKRRRQKYEFKPDRNGAHFLKKLYMTRLQRLQLLRWTLYSALCIVLLVVQDSILSRVRIWGATTDMAVGIIVLISLHEGLERGSTFALCAAVFYAFSGSAPGPHTIAILTLLVFGAAYMRQVFWNKSFGATALCTVAVIIVYELTIFAAGLFLGLTIPARAGVYLLAGIMTAALTLPLYPVVRAIGKIGGDPWNE